MDGVRTAVGLSRQLRPLRFTRDLDEQLLVQPSSTSHEQATDQTEQQLDDEHSSLWCVFVLRRAKAI